MGRFRLLGRGVLPSWQDAWVSSAAMVPDLPSPEPCLLGTPWLAWASCAPSCLPGLAAGLFGVSEV